MKTIPVSNIQLAEGHKKSVDLAIQRIRTMSSEESSFIQLELLYYDVLSIARAYGNNINENAMLARLKHIESNEYKHAQEIFKKSNQKVIAIHKFRMAIKKELSSWVKA